MKVDLKIPRRELAEMIGINTSAIQKSLAKLKDAGYVKRVVPNFGGYWEVQN